MHVKREKTTSRTPGVGEAVKPTSSVRILRMAENNLCHDNLRFDKVKTPWEDLGGECRPSKMKAAAALQLPQSLNHSAQCKQRKTL